MDLRELTPDGGDQPIDPATHWYYRSKCKAVLQAIAGITPTSVLDVGAGSGFFAREMLRRVPSLRAATCVDSGYTTSTTEFVDGKPLFFVPSVTDAQADLLVMMDVIEHVADDVALMREYVAQAAPGAHVLVTVPAFAALWSGHDDYLQHYRRYSLASLTDAVRAAGLTLERCHYIYGALFPLAAASRIGARLRARLAGKNEPAKSALREHAAPVNWLFEKICDAEMHVAARNKLAGLTVLALARVGSR